MSTLKRKVIVIAIGLIILSTSTIAHTQDTKANTEISKNQLIKELQTQITQLQDVVKTHEAEIQRLKALCKEAGIDPDPKVEREKIVMPKYSVLDEDVYDAPIKAQVELNILVSGEITESGLRELLNELYTSTKAKKGFKYHNSPTNIYIYAFTSKERFESGMGQWIAMMAKNYDDIKPEISINKRQIAHLGNKPEERFGLSEAQRIQIWKEYIGTEDRSMEEAEKRYPLTYPHTQGLSESEISERIKKNAEMMHRLEKRYKNELAIKYSLTSKQLEEIANEGIEKSWPFPK